MDGDNTFWGKSRRLATLFVGDDPLPVHTFAKGAMERAMLADYQEAIEASFPFTMAKALLRSELKRCPSMGMLIRGRHWKPLGWLSGGTDSGKLTPDMIEDSLTAMMGHSSGSEEAAAGIVQTMALLPDYPKQFLNQLHNWEGGESWEYDGIPDLVKRVLYNALSEGNTIEGDDGRDIIREGLWELYEDLAKQYGRYSLEPFFDPFLELCLAREWEGPREKEHKRKRAGRKDEAKEGVQRKKRVALAGDDNSMGDDPKGDGLNQADNDDDGEEVD